MRMKCSFFYMWICYWKFLNECEYALNCVIYCNIWLDKWCTVGDFENSWMHIYCMGLTFYKHEQIIYCACTCIQTYDNSKDAGHWDALKCKLCDESSETFAVVLRRSLSCPYLGTLRWTIPLYVCILMNFTVTV